MNLLSTVLLASTAAQTFAQSERVLRMSSAMSNETASIDHSRVNEVRSAEFDVLPRVSNGGWNQHQYTDDIKGYVVEAHNRARAYLVPSEASNMRKLRWDEALATEASELVSGCQFTHDTENGAYGQNLMLGDAQINRETVDNWISQWVSEELTEEDHEGTGTMTLDHASAVLWAESYLVGCASNLCPQGYLTACNYFPAGNMEGAKAYTPGKSCSACPPQANSCDATGKLCTAPEGGAPAPEPQPTPAPQPQPTPAPQPQPTPAPQPAPAPAPAPQPAPAPAPKPQPAPAPAPAPVLPKLESAEVASDALPPQAKKTPKSCHS